MLASSFFIALAGFRPCNSQPPEFRDYKINTSCLAHFEVLNHLPIIKKYGKRGTSPNHAQLCSSLNHLKTVLGGGVGGSLFHYHLILHYLAHLQFSLGL